MTASPGQFGDIRRHMLALKIYEKDIKETFVRSSGPGGQNVNKVSTCVVLHHQPSGITVKSQEERTQALNRHTARLRLIGKIERQIKSERLKVRQEKAKRRRQNRRRSSASKERMLENKKQMSQLKQLRRKIKDF